MVDFNGESTITTPAANVVKIMVLQDWNNLNEALEFYNRRISQGQESDQSIVRVRLATLFRKLRPYMIRHNRTADAEKLYNQLMFNYNDLSKEELTAAIDLIEDALDRIKLTRIDLRPEYDKTDIERDNLENGYS